VADEHGAADDHEQCYRRPRDERRHHRTATLRFHGSGLGGRELLLEIGGGLDHLIAFALGPEELALCRLGIGGRPPEFPLEADHPRTKRAVFLQQLGFSRGRDHLKRTGERFLESGDRAWVVAHADRVRAPDELGHHELSAKSEVAVLLADRERPDADRARWDRAPGLEGPSPDREHIDPEWSTFEDLLFALRDRDVGLGDRVAAWLVVGAIQIDECAAVGGGGGRHDELRPQRRPDDGRDDAHAGRAHPDLLSPSKSLP
jgi:hypothetical protein